MLINVDDVDDDDDLKFGDGDGPNLCRVKK